jgi:carbonic anhydrase
MTANTEDELHQKISELSGQDATWQPFNVIPDQQRALAEDVRKVRSHPLIPESVKVGGFVYDVDTGLLTQYV